MSSLLWKVYVKDKDACHYIFGTMHTSSIEALNYIDTIKSFIDNTECYAGETDLGDSRMGEIINYFYLPENKLLSSYFSVKHYKKATITLKKIYNIDLNEYERFIPMYLINLINQNIISSNQSSSLDQRLWDYALDMGKLMKGIESVDDQINILKEIPLSYQCKSFKKLLRNTNKNQKSIERINNLYVKQNIKELYKKSKKELGNLKNMMIYDRNIKMTQSIINLISEQPTFIAIGAAHLYGNKGVLRLLKSFGYKVKPVELFI